MNRTNNYQLPSVTLIGAALVTALANVGVHAFDCSSYTGSSTLQQEFVSNSAGVDIGQIQGTVNVQALDENKCKLDFNLETPSSLNIDRLTWYERPSYNTDSGKKINCEVSNGAKSCIVANSGPTSRVDSLALFDEASKSVYATVKFSGGSPAPSAKASQPLPTSDSAKASDPKQKPEQAQQDTAPEAAKDGKNPKVITYHPGDGSTPFECIPREKGTGSDPVHPPNAAPAHQQHPPAHKNTTPSLPPVGGEPPVASDKSKKGNNTNPAPVEKKGNNTNPAPVEKKGNNTNPAPEGSDKDIFSGSLSTASPLGYASIITILGAILVSSL